MILVFIHSINIPCEPDLDPDSDELHEQNMRSKLIHQPRPLFGGAGHGPPGGQPPFLAAGLAAAMAAAAQAASAAAASKQPPNGPQSPHHPGAAAGLQAAVAAAAAASAAGAAAAAGSGANPGSLFFGLNGWQPPVSAPSFPPLGFPGFQHPLFKPGM